MLTAEQIKFISSSIYFRIDDNGQLSRVSGLDDDMFVTGKVAQNHTDGNIGKHFDSHGIAKGTISEQIETLNSILSNGIISDKTFYTAPWSIPSEDIAGVGAALGTSGGTANTGGLFTLVGDYDKLIKTKDDIKFVAVNSPAYPYIEALQKSFPGVKFVKMSDMPKTISEYYAQRLSNKAAKYSDADKKLLAMELFGYGRMDVAEVIVSGDLRTGIRKPVARFSTWGAKDSVSSSPQDIDRITEILKRFGLEYELGNIGFLGQQTIQINTPPDNPTVKWLLSVYDTIKNEKHLQDQALRLAGKYRQSAQDSK
ncbi:MAG: hypothetical protein FWC61_04875 [Proteobacteria bacterium]|nr:hypothetical protein [Pseudomonadota bacterium]